MLALGFFIDFFMGAGAISVAFVTPSDFPVVGVLRLAVRWSPPDHSICSVGFYLFFNFFFSVSLFILLLLRI